MELEGLAFEMASLPWKRVDDPYFVVIFFIKLLPKKIFFTHKLSQLLKSIAVDLSDSTMNR